MKDDKIGCSEDVETFKNFFELVKKFGCAYPVRTSHLANSKIDKTSENKFSSNWNSPTFGSNVGVVPDSKCKKLDTVQLQIPVQPKTKVVV